MEKYGKNRNREKPTFANVNFLCGCNAKCFFCVGNEAVCKKKVVGEFPNIDKYIKKCHDLGIEKIYFTGLDSEPTLDPRMSELANKLKAAGFKVGLRTNGLINSKELYSIFDEEISISVHSFNDEINRKIGIATIKDTEKLFNSLKGKTHRYAIVVNRYNKDDIFNTLEMLSHDGECRYVQIRQICTDYNYEYYKEDIEAFSKVKQAVMNKCEYMNDFYNMGQYKYKDLQVSLWEPLAATVNSINYFTDGLITDNYFIIEGYNAAQNGGKE